MGCEYRGKMSAVRHRWTMELASGPVGFEPCGLGVSALERASDFTEMPSCPSYLVGDASSCYAL